MQHQLRIEIVTENKDQMNLTILLQNQSEKLGYSVLIHNISNLSQMLHEHFAAIKAFDADLYIFIDGAGFNLRTESDGWSINQLHGIKALIFADTTKDIFLPYKQGDDREQLADFIYDIRSWDSEMSALNPEEREEYLNIHIKELIDTILKEAELI